VCKTVNLKVPFFTERRVKNKFEKPKNSVFSAKKTGFYNGIYVHIFGGEVDQSATA
jgi:hypothetical protein